MSSAKFFEVLQYSEKGGRLSFEDLLLLLSASGKEEFEALLASADRIRKKFVGDEIHLRGIVEFSNICIQNCWYCGLRRDNHQLFRYRMDSAEIVEAAKMVKSRGLKTLVLQSGEDPWFTRERISGLIQEIKGSTGLTITLSVGERPDRGLRGLEKRRGGSLPLETRDRLPDSFPPPSSGAKTGRPAEFP